MLAQIADPAPEHLFEMLEVEHAEPPLEGVGRGHVIAQDQKASQRRLVCLAPFGDLGDGVAIGKMATTSISRTSCRVPLLGRRGFSMSSRHSMRLRGEGARACWSKKTRVDAV